jgi:hypothetical protein
MGSVYCPLHRISRHGTKSGLTSAQKRALRAVRREEWAVEVKARRQRARKVLDKARHALPARTYEAIIGYYGLDGHEPRTLVDLGEQFGLTRERIRQIIAPFRATAEALGIFDTRKGNWRYRPEQREFKL